MPIEISDRFPRYTDFDPAVPVWCITPDAPRTIHRFFDTSPISPSGRYAALTRLPYEDRLPAPGDEAEVVVVDLGGGAERVVARTRGWDTQLGANVQWGASDSELFFNDVDTSDWRAYGVVLDPETGERRELGGTVYMVSPDGAAVASQCLLRNAKTQAGYGVVVPPDAVPVNSGASDDDGLYVTRVDSGEVKLVASFARIFEEAFSPAERDLCLADPCGALYGAHVKWNPQGTRIMFVLRWHPSETADGDISGIRPSLVTMRPDGGEISMAIPAATWALGGHHPNWCPDGEHALMNLRLHGAGTEMLFVRCRFDGEGLSAFTEAVPGSGHPSLHPGARHMVTDGMREGAPERVDGPDRIRLVDVEAGTEKVVARVPIDPEFPGPRRELRIDPHPAWSRDFARIAFNGHREGTRRVFVADLSSEVG